MRLHHIVILIAICMLIGASYAEVTSDAMIEASKQVYISGVTYDPAVFFTDDVGTVTFEVTNGNQDQSVVVNHASFGDSDIKRTSETYAYSTTIGPGQTRGYTFSVVAASVTGTYYPSFSLSFYGANSLWEKKPVKIDNAPLVVIVTDRPDSFAEGKKDTVSVEISNPRGNEVRNVIAYISGEGVDVVPSEVFVGDIMSGESVSLDVAVTPYQPSDLIIAVDYQNGDNPHGVSTDTSIVFSTDKLQADIIISNVVVTSQGGLYYVKGDVTNSGLQNANSVIITSSEPATPQDPYKNYVIGALKPDDFGSFELTFDANGETSVPLKLFYKDKDGNVITTEYTVNVEKATLSGNLPAPSLPVVPIIIVVALGIVGLVVYYKRKH